MKKLLFILLIISSIVVKGSQLMSAWEFKEIYQLYFDQQYDVVKAKMKSFGFQLYSEVPPYSYDNVSYMGEFIFVKKYNEQVYSSGYVVDVVRSVEFKFKAMCEGSFIESRIDFKSETTNLKVFLLKI